MCSKCEQFNIYLYVWIQNNQQNVMKLIKIGEQHICEEIKSEIKH